MTYNGMADVDRESRAFLVMERARVEAEIHAATTVPELIAIAQTAMRTVEWIGGKEVSVWNDELKAIGAKKKDVLQKYAGGGNGKSSMPTTAAEWADREEMRLTGTEMAKERIAKRTQAVDLPVMPTLADLLSEDDEDESYRIQGLIPVGGRIILSAPMKSGKTTLVGNLVRSLADGDDFLGKFPVTSLGDESVVTILDTEMSKRQMKQWLRDQGIKNPQRVHPVSLRGQVGSFAIMDDTVRAQWAAQLRDMNTEILVLDPLGPVLDSFNVDENTSAVGTLLAAIDALAQEAGIQEVFIMHHTGHEGERARGHSKLRGWPDAEWFLRRDLKNEEDPARYFKAFGRDVDVAETLMEYDTTTRHLILADPFDGQPVNRVNAKNGVKMRELQIAIIQAVNETPGIAAGKLWEAIGVRSDKGGAKARDAAVEAGQIRMESRAGAYYHYPLISEGQCSPDDLG